MELHPPVILALCFVSDKKKEAEMLGFLLAFSCALVLTLLAYRAVGVPLSLHRCCSLFAAGLQSPLRWEHLLVFRITLCCFAAAVGLHVSSPLWRNLVVFCRGLPLLLVGAVALNVAGAAYLSRCCWTVGIRHPLVFLQRILASGSCQIDHAIDALDGAEAYDTAMVMVEFEGGRTAVIDVCRQAPYG